MNLALRVVIEQLAKLEIFSMRFNISSSVQR